MHKLKMADTLHYGGIDFMEKKLNAEYGIIFDKKDSKFSFLPYAIIEDELAVILKIKYPSMLFYEV